MLALITALLGAIPQIIGAVAVLHPPAIPSLPINPPVMPPADPISVVEANAVNKANLEAGQAVPLATYQEGDGSYTILVVKNGGPAASMIGL